MATKAGAIHTFAVEATCEIISETYLAEASIPPERIEARTQVRHIRSIARGLQDVWEASFQAGRDAYAKDLAQGRVPGFRVETRSH